MTDRLCLRCDWHGATDRMTCPTCAAQLYRVDERPRAAGPPAASGPEVRSLEAASTGMVASSSAPRSTPPSPSTDPPAEIEPTRRSSSVVVFVVTALALVVALNGWFHGHTSDRRPTAPRPIVLTGTLVYAVPDGDHWSRLWRWDLTTDRVARGPRIPRAVDLVHVSGGDPRLVGVTSELSSGQLQASVLRSLRPSGRERSIARGDIVVWDPHGRSVASVRSRPLGSGCERRVSIDWAKVVPAIRERKYLDPSLCGDVLSVGLDDTATYLTLVRDGRVGIYLAGVGLIHPILPGHALISMSAVSDMIVIPASSLSDLGPLVLRPEHEHFDLPEARLFLRGEGAHLLTPFGVGADRFAIYGVLAWSPDGLIALTEGVMGHQRGLFELSAGPASGERIPTYVGPVGGVAHATFTADGTPIVVTHEGVFAIVHDSMVPLMPPVNAPAPDGPLVWFA